MAGIGPSSDLKQLQSNQKNIRNICILAHVDHGKTTLADSLIASNGIISKRQAGKVRYLDSREDEQSRGITMKSSAISLRYCEEADNEYLINLIDSPGHVDFSSEVSTAVWLCDGAIVVVDVIEGVCPQTKVVLEQAWLEGIKPCLVLNKIDRLVTELSKSPMEAYDHIKHVLEQVNAVTGTLWTRGVMQQQYQQQQGQEEHGEKGDSPVRDEQQGERLEDVVYDWSVPGLEEEDDSNVYFSPEFGNVIFTSAREGWGFSIDDFARMYSSKLGMRESVLCRTLWGDYYLNAKTKRIHKGAFNKGKKPLFTQFVLDNIWAVYNAVQSPHRDKDKIKRITTALGLKMTPREFSHSDRAVQLAAIFTQWLPLADAVLKMVVQHLPSPLELSGERVEKIMTTGSRAFCSYPIQTQGLKKDIVTCSNSRAAPTIVFVSKLFPVDSQMLPKHRGKSLTQEELLAMRDNVKEKVLNKFSEGSERMEPEDENDVEEATPLTTEATEFLGFARVFSGTISQGQEIHVLQPQYDPGIDQGEEEGPNLRVTTVTMGELYLLMGREVVEVDSVGAGNVLGIGGLGDHVLKCATLSSTFACPAFRSSHFAASPIVHVAVEPLHLSDMAQLVKGMKLLSQADPCVEVTVQETGQHILSTAGEVHLKRCLDDLRDTFARVELSVSEPIVPFRETIIDRPTVDMVNEAITSDNEVKRVTNPLLARAEGEEGGDSSEGVVTVYTANKMCLLRLKTTPLPLGVIEVLTQNSQLLKFLVSTTLTMSDETKSKLTKLKQTLEEGFSSAEGDWVGVVDSIMAFGPRGVGPNILVNKVGGYNRPSVWKCLDDPIVRGANVMREYDNSVVSGFQLAALSGPLCEEPIHGVCYSLLEWTTVTHGQTDSTSNGNDNGDMGNTSDTCNDRDGDVESDVAGGDGVKNDSYGPFSGQLISAMKEGCRRAFLVQPTRLMAAMYSCGILATASILGQVYAVISRRSGRVINDEMIEGSEMFVINSLIPVAESFGFAEEIRKKTGGLAMPQLVFSHWEVIPSDPFWVPSTEEELVHFGDKADNESVAKVYMNSIRRRKGLSVEEKLVEHAEKQRTLKRNK